MYLLSFTKNCLYHYIGVAFVPVAGAGLERIFRVLVVAVAGGAVLRPPAFDGTHSGAVEEVSRVVVQPRKARRPARSPICKPATASRSAFLSSVRLVVMLTGLGCRSAVGEKSFHGVNAWHAHPKGKRPTDESSTRHGPIRKVVLNTPVHRPTTLPHCDQSSTRR